MKQFISQFFMLLLTIITLGVFSPLCLFADSTYEYNLEDYGVLLWDLTGNYTDNIFGLDVDYSIAQDSMGKLIGIGDVNTYDSEKGLFIKVSLDVKGTVKQKNGVTKVKMISRGTGKADDGKESYELKYTKKFNAVINPLTLTIEGKATEKIAIKGLNLYLETSDVSLPLPPGMNGASRLSIAIEKTGKKLVGSGNSTLVLNNGRTIFFGASGTYRWKINKSSISLKGNGDAKGCSLAPVINSAEGFIMSIKGKILGQRVKYSVSRGLTHELNLGELWDMVQKSDAGDRDGDFLPDDIEQKIGTDPDNPDTDGDGIRDLIEIFGDWSFRDDDPIPDLDKDNIIAPLDPDDNGDGNFDGNDVDTDGDGIPNYLEYYGYTYDWLTGTYALWEEGNTEKPYFKTDPLQPSTDQDPYSDAMEVTGTLMDVLVDNPGDLPMVPASPNIVVRLEGYDITLNGEITYTQGGSLAKESSWSRQTTSEHSQQWGVQAEHTSTIKVVAQDYGYEGSIMIGASYGETNTTSYASSIGQSIISESNWQKATSTTPTTAARIKLKLKVYNYGTAAASNVLPTLTMKIGGISTLTLKPANPINILVPGGVYPPQQGTYWVVDKIEGMDTEPYIHLTLEELRAIESGVPVSIAVTQVDSDVMRLNSDWQWESAGKWSEYMARCEAVCSNIFLDVGHGNFIHYLVYSDDSVTSPKVTFGDALNWIAGYRIQDRQPYITYYDSFNIQKKTMPLNGFNFIVDNETLTNNGWEIIDGKLTHPLGEAFDINKMVLNQRSVVVGKVGRDEIQETCPTIHYAYYDEQYDHVVVLANDYIGLKEVSLIYPGSSPVVMEEDIRGSGLYILDEIRSVFSLGKYENPCDTGFTVEAINTSDENTSADVECLQYPEINPDKPKILSVSVKSTENGDITINVKAQGTDAWPIAKVWVYDPNNPINEIVLDKDLNYWSGDADRYFQKIEGMAFNDLSKLVVVAECDRDTCPVTNGNCYTTYTVSPVDIDLESLDHGTGELTNREEHYLVAFRALYSHLNFYEDMDPEGGYDFSHPGSDWTSLYDCNSADDVDGSDSEIFMVGDCSCGGINMIHRTYMRVNTNWIDATPWTATTGTTSERQADYDQWTPQRIYDHLMSNGWGISKDYDYTVHHKFPIEESYCENYYDNEYHIIIFEIPNTSYVVKMMFYDYSLGHNVDYTNSIKYVYDVYNLGMVDD